VCDLLIFLHESAKPHEARSKLSLLEGKRYILSCLLQNTYPVTVSTAASLVSRPLSVSRLVGGWRREAGKRQEARGDGE